MIVAGHIYWLACDYDSFLGYWRITFISECHPLLLRMITKAMAFLRVTIIYSVQE